MNLPMQTISLFLSFTSAWLTTERTKSPQGFFFADCFVCCQPWQHSIVFFSFLTSVIVDFSLVVHSSIAKSVKEKGVVWLSQRKRSTERNLARKWTHYKSSHFDHSFTRIFSFHHFNTRTLPKWKMSKAKTTATASKSGGAESSVYPRVLFCYHIIHFKYIQTLIIRSVHRLYNMNDSDGIFSNNDFQNSEYIFILISESTIISDNQIRGCRQGVISWEHLYMRARASLLSLSSLLICLYLQ